MKISHYIKSITVIISTIILAGTIFHSVKYYRNFDHYVEVKGLAEEIVIADQASWHINIAYSSDDLKDIYKNIVQQQDTIINFLHQKGINSNDIQKQTISIIDNSNNTYNNNTNFKKYSANSGISVNTNNINNLQQVSNNINILVESGVLITSTYASYLYTKLNDIKAQMINKALINAKITANQFAKQTNDKLGGIKNASQGLFTITAPDGNFNDASIQKKVRVVTSVQFFIN
jgi:hypothetical protein